MTHASRRKIDFHHPNLDIKWANEKGILHEPTLSQPFRVLKVKLIDTVCENKVFGELGLIYNRQRLATAVALENLTVACLDKK